MKLWSRPLVVFLSSVLSIGSFSVIRSEAAQAVGATAVSPTTVPVGVGTSVRVTAVIDDPSLVVSSVRLQRYDTSIGGTPLARALVTVLGTLVDDGTNGDTVAGDKTFSIVVTVFEVNPRPITFRVSAEFQGKLTPALSAPVTVNVVGTATGINIATPANLAFLNTSPVLVTGTVRDPAAQVTVNGVEAATSGNTFTASVPLLEGTNTLTAVASNSNNTQTTASIQATLDTTPPRVTITSPDDGFVTTSDAITVSGLVNDIVVGTVNDQQATVLVNGLAAQVANRSFLASTVPLTLGNNTIQATALDRVGNQATMTIHVTRREPTEPSVRVVSGNNQTGPVGTVLPARLVAEVRNVLNQLVPGVPVVFRVTENSGGLINGAPPVAALAVTSDAQGQAAVQFQLGTRSGVGNNVVEANAVGFTGPAIFTASATPTAARLIVVDTGNNQTGAVGQPLPLPFVAIVTDETFNRLAGVSVTFRVRQGGGTFGGQTSRTVTSDGDGRIAVVLTLGTQEGQDNQVVDATFTGNAGLPATFVASGRIPGDPAATQVTGVVFDNSNLPIPGVTMRLFRTHHGVGLPEEVVPAVKTNEEGRFVIHPAPVGAFKLMADGTTVPPERGTFPTVEYDIVTVAGQNNTVGMPVYLPVLDTVNKLCVSETTGGTLTLPEVPGFSLTVAAGSATFPGGARSGCISVSTVNADKSPMTPGFGQQPRFLITIQPVGTMFNPPAPITMPNVDGLQPGQVIELYSYDHDLAAFTAIGTGTVSEDGAIVRSDPGVGILKAGWHCGGTPNQPGSGEVVHVKITTPDPVGVLKDKTTTIVSVGGPLPGTYSWKSSDPAIAAIQGANTGASVVVKGVAGGTAVLTVRFTCDSVDANGVHPFAEASITVKVVSIEFQTAAGAALASPFRVGVSASGHDRKQALKAVVTPASEASNVTLSAGARLTMSDVTTSGNTITFKLVGTAKSTAKGDTKITATYKGSAFDHPVTVVIPGSVGTPHDVTGGGLISENRALDASTTPSFVGLPAGQVALFTIHIRILTITVVDQFGDGLGNLYDGAIVSEGALGDINQRLTATGTYSDPVGIGRMGSVVAAGSAAATAWPSQPLLPLANQSVDTSRPVEIDGFVLNPAVVNRTATWTNPSTLTITWP